MWATVLVMIMQLGTLLLVAWATHEFGSDHTVVVSVHERPRRWSGPPEGQPARVRPHDQGGAADAVSLRLAAKVARPPGPARRRRDRRHCRPQPVRPGWRRSPRPLRQQTPAPTTQPAVKPKVRIAKLIASADAELVSELPTITALVEVEVSALIMNLRRFAVLEARLDRVAERVQEQLGHEADEDEWFALTEDLGVSLVRPALERLAEAHPDRLSRSA